MDKLRILCLHGFTQNKEVFKEKTGSFRKPLKKYVDFEFLDAPHKLNNIHLQENSQESASLHAVLPETNIDARGWWLKEVPNGESEGLLESLATFEARLVENGPFDGIMGFSQGAAFLALACILLQEKVCFAAVRFVILVAGFKSTVQAHEAYYQLEAKINIPSLHVIGSSDEVITSNRSRALLEMFTSAQIASHPGGHFVPASKDLREIYKKFIEQFLNK